jgi:hypothetical protein
MVHLCATTNKVTAQETADLFVHNVFKLHGVPTDIVSDRGPQFSGTFWQGLTKALGSSSKLSTAYHPQTDGQTERANRVVADTLRHYCDYAQDDWDMQLPLVEFALNNAISAATGMTPFFALYGYHPQLMASINLPECKNPQVNTTAETLRVRLQRAKECIQAAQDRMKRQYDQGHKPQTFQADEFVLLSTKNIRIPGPSKLLPRFVGPYQVVKRIGEQAYELALPANMKIHKVFHTSLLRPYRSDGPAQPPPVEWLDGEAQWEVERILGHTRTKNHKGRWVTKYLVRWAGYPSPDEDTWEPKSQFTNDSLIKAYWQALGQAEPTT